MKELKLDNKLRKVFSSPEVIIIFSAIAITVLAIIIRASMLGTVTFDYNGFLSKWIDYIRETGGLKALATQFADYNIPYLLILTGLSYIPINSLFTIKIVSIIFDFILAIYACRIVLELTKNHKCSKLFGLLTYAFVIMLPTVCLNSSAWAQCDSIYVAFVVMSLYYMIKNKTLAAFILFAIAFTFKLQAIFILPVYLLLYLKRKNISILHFLLIPLIFVISVLPAVFAGRGFFDCLMIYAKQTGSYTASTLNFPNFYTILPDFFSDQIIALVVLTIFILLVMIVYILYKKYEVSNKSLLNLTVLFTLVIVFFLPRMHERYNYIAEVLVIAYFFVNRKNIFIPIAIQLCSLTGYLRYLGDLSVNYQKVASIVLFVAIIMLAKEVFKTLEDENIKNENHDKEQKKLKVTTS